MSSAASLSSIDVNAIRVKLEAAAVPGNAVVMRAYMQDRFEFFGVKTPARRAISSEALALARRSSQHDLLKFAQRCWSEPEREFQYLGADTLKAGHAQLGPTGLDALAALIAERSRWDTVDTLASWPVGSIVMRHPDAAQVMDAWIRSDNLWIARAAILHQLRAKDDTDLDRLFAYALARAADTDFFIRKAIGWSLRQYAHTDPAPIVHFVKMHEAQLSNLTRREALKNVA